MAKKLVYDQETEGTVSFEKKGQTFEGYYKGYTERQGKFGVSKLHAFETEGGSVGIWGSSNLDTKLSAIEKGCMTYITYQGKVDLPSGMTLKKFEVYVDDELRLDSAILAAPAVEEDAVEEAVDEDQSDIDEDTMEASDEEEEDVAPKAPLARKPITKGKPATVTREAASAVEGLLSKKKRV